MAKTGKERTGGNILARWIRQLDQSLRGIARPTKIFAVSLSCVIVMIFAGVMFVNQKFLAPVDKNDTTLISVEIPRGSSVNTIAKALEEAGVLRSSTAFKLFVDLQDKSSKMKAGTYQFSKAMSLSEITDMLTTGSTTENVLKILLKEGGTAEELGNTLTTLGLSTDAVTFLNNIKDISSYENYAFIDEIKNETAQRKVPLEGYLFPDTYLVYRDADTQSIVNKFLQRFQQIYTPEYEARASELNMTTDEVITLASLIQMEAKTGDFKKVSAVFHNRLKANMKLGSDVTVQYVLGKKKLNLTSEDTAVDSPYNTYKYTGLPVGPICNPGKDAIEAALWPDEDFISQNILYFCLADPETNELVYARTLEEHNQNVEKYRPLWEAYDKKHGL